MLVLSRRVGESIVVGDDVTVTVLEVRGDVVRIGIQAPRSVAVHREELLRELEAANKEAASADDDAVAALAEAVKKRGRVARHRVDLTGSPRDAVRSAGRLERRAHRQRLVEHHLHAAVGPRVEQHRAPAGSPSPPRPSLPGFTTTRASASSADVRSSAATVSSSISTS